MRWTGPGVADIGGTAGGVRDPEIPSFRITQNTCECRGEDGPRAADPRGPDAPTLSDIIPPANYREAGVAVATAGLDSGPGFLMAIRPHIHFRLAIAALIQSKSSYAISFVTAAVSL